MASWVMPLFVIVAAVSLFVQMLIFGAMFLTIRRLSKRMEEIADDLQRRINPVISRLQMLVEEAQPRISNMISDAAEITHVARNQVQRVDRMVTEAVDRLRMQLVHADQILTGALETVEETGARIRSTVWRPVQSFSALVRGIQTGLEFYRGRRRQADGVTEQQDEELFI
jgi:chromatin segregation and condensation protein Rec8/ScpA/Scc1 (kleisin family)